MAIIDSRSAREVFESSFVFAPIGKALVGLEGQFLKVNKALCDMVGYGEEELLRTSFQQLTHPEDLDNDLAFLSTLQTGRIPSYRTQKRYYHKNRSIIWVEVSVALVRREDGKPHFYVTQVSDISVSKQAEMVGNAFFIHSPDLLAVTTSDGRFVRSNPAWDGQLGWAMDDLAGLHLLALIHPDDRELAVQSHERVRHGEAPARYESRCLTVHGDYRWVEWTTVIRKDLHFYHAGRDCTHRRLAADQLGMITAETREIVDHMPVLMGYWDRNLVTQFLNKPFSAKLGVAPMAAKGVALPALVGVELYRKHERMIRLGLQGHPVSFEQDFPDLRGNMVKTRVSILPQRHGAEGIYIIVTAAEGEAANGGI
ncbi:PAS domain-containing protein [Noviherbaspirillum galbum]|uniref:histidine kinase n=1 Tax=Noviherbaspirillum galbum TaxID=2709383 RepID=A0A6B3SZK2_9BURK|nr:PAS domain-containing protein [Noviherbaspirillum galbum]NEX64189.1 PAS domain S-box protein [Noviherbaspirillum galbum]